MRKRVLASITAAISIPGIVIGAGVASRSSDHGSAVRKATTLVVQAVSDKSISLSVNPKGNPGDQIVFSENLFSNGRKVGTDAGVCTAVPDPDNSHYQCTVTFQFAQGQVAVGGLINFTDARPVIPIVGGTGKYRAARGEFDFTSQTSTSFTDTFSFNP